MGHGTTCRNIANLRPLHPLTIFLWTTNIGCGFNGGFFNAAHGCRMNWRNNDCLFFVMKFCCLRLAVDYCFCANLPSVLVPKIHPRREYPRCVKKCLHNVVQCHTMCNMKHLMWTIRVKTKTKTTTHCSATFGIDSQSKPKVSASWHTCAQCLEKLASLFTLVDVYLFSSLNILLY